MLPSQQSLVPQTPPPVPSTGARLALATLPGQTVPPTYESNPHRLTASLADIWHEEERDVMLVGAPGPRLELPQIEVPRGPMETRDLLQERLDDAVLSILDRVDGIVMHHRPGAALNAAAEHHDTVVLRWLHGLDETGDDGPIGCVRTHPAQSGDHPLILPGILASRFHLTSGADGYCAYHGPLDDLEAAQRALDVARLNRMVIKLGGGNGLDTPFRQRQFERLRKPRSPTAVQEQGAMIASQRQFLFGNAAVALVTAPIGEFDLSLIEALACGTPVVVFGATHMEEFVEEGVTGYVAHTLDEAVEAVAKARRLPRREVRRAFEARWTARRMAQEAMALFERRSARFRVAPATRNGGAERPFLRDTDTASHPKENDMALNSLKDVYVDQLQDLYSANKQSLDVTRKLAEEASDEDLKKALQAGADGIEQGMKAVEEIVRGHDADPNGEHCKGMEGLVAEAKAHALEEEFGDDDVRDAMIITQYQRMVHYALAGYGCVAAFAKRLELSDDAGKLEKCLDDTYDGDRHMTDIATGHVNQAAAA